MMELRMNRGRHRSGTSMVELLVVIVIFLVGILAVVQVFPRGFQVISNTKNMTVAINLGRGEMGRLTSRTDQLPERIDSVIYLWNGTNVTIAFDPNRNPNDLGPFSNRIDQDGNMLDGGGNILGKWQYLTGANNFRRVIGEGGAVPAPRRVGSFVGGLMVLQFAPIVFNPNYASIFQVYGNDLVRRVGDPPFTANRPYEYYVANDDDATASVWLAADPAKPRNYRLTMAAWIQSGSNSFRRELTSTITVAPGVGYFNYPLGNYAGLQVGESFLGVEYDSIRISRIFDAVVGSFSADPYEYRLLDETLGLILFNPKAYNYQERRGGNRRVALTARVDYDVYDWRIIREEFRIADTAPTEQRLRLGNLMTKNRIGADGKPWPGLNVLVSDEVGGTENRDFLILDLDTGGIYSKNSFVVDYSGGMVTFKDSDGNPANGVQVGLVYPGDVAPTLVTANGRNVRCLYSAVGEYSVQVSKAASTYRASYGNPGSAEFYAGGSGAYYTGVNLAPGESLTRIYFPPMDAGKKVTIGEIFYNTSGGGEPSVLRNQDFLIRNSPPDAAVGLPYLDLRDVADNAVSINYARYGYGVRNVRGASVSVRVLWNPATFALSNDEAVNLDRIEIWGRNWRRVQTDSYMTKGDSQ